jgi:hypothetical protein
MHVDVKEEDLDLSNASISESPHLFWFYQLWRVLRLRRLRFFWKRPWLSRHDQSKQSIFAHIRPQTTPARPTDRPHVEGQRVCHQTKWCNYPSINIVIMIFTFWISHQVIDRQRTWQFPRGGRGPCLYWVHFGVFTKTSNCHLTCFRFGSVMVNGPQQCQVNPSFYLIGVFNTTKQSGVRASVSHHHSRSHQKPPNCCCAFFGDQGFWGMLLSFVGRRGRVLTLHPPVVLHRKHASQGWRRS